jgi:hypothetical protein
MNNDEDELTDASKNGNNKSNNSAIYLIASRSLQLELRMVTA